MQNVRGIQTSLDAPTIKWPNGTETVLPYVVLQDNINALQNDADWVAYMSQCPMLVTEDLRVCQLTEDDPNLLSRTRGALSSGRAVLLRAPAPVTERSINMAYLHQAWGMLPGRRVEVHGM